MARHPNPLVEMSARHDKEVPCREHSATHFRAAASCGGLSVWRPKSNAWLDHELISTQTSLGHALDETEPASHRERPKSTLGSA